MGGGNGTASTARAACTRFVLGATKPYIPRTSTYLDDITFAPLPEKACTYNYTHNNCYACTIIDYVKQLELENVEKKIML